MHWLLNAYVRRYHRHCHSSGHLWQGRFKAFPIEEDWLAFVQQPLTAGELQQVRRMPLFRSRFRGFRISHLSGRISSGRNAGVLHSETMFLPAAIYRYVLFQTCDAKNDPSLEGHAGGKFG